MNLHTITQTLSRMTPQDAVAYIGSQGFEISRATSEHVNFEHRHPAYLMDFTWTLKLGEGSCIVEGWEDIPLEIRAWAEAYPSGDAVAKVEELRALAICERALV